MIYYINICAGISCLSFFFLVALSSPPLMFSTTMRLLTMNLKTKLWLGPFLEPFIRILKDGVRALNNRWGKHVVLQKDSIWTNHRKDVLCCWPEPSVKRALKNNESKFLNRSESESSESGIPPPFVSLSPLLIKYAYPMTHETLNFDILINESKLQELD